MKNLFYAIALMFLFVNSNYAQTPPVAVNDTFVVSLENDSIKVLRGSLIGNDFDVDGNAKIVDTVLYN
ncbi:MAG: hypothetical protein KDD29_05090, partial [Flavobacteriales bacterium]|nr:hypothetical protein [Flavobacteriales bacterium]